MKFKLNQRGFIFMELAMALPLLILLLYALGTLTLTTWKIAHEQVADYVLETEAQEVIDRITRDARAAYSAKIENGTYFDKIIFACHTQENTALQLTDTLDQRIYVVDNANNKPFHFYFKHQNNDAHNNPLTGESRAFGNTIVTKFELKKLAPKVLHITLEMKSNVTNQKVKFTTAVYMPSCQDE